MKDKYDFSKAERGPIMKGLTTWQVQRRFILSDTWRTIETVDSYKKAEEKMNKDSGRWYGFLFAYRLNGQGVNY